VTVGCYHIDCGFITMSSKRKRISSEMFVAEENFTYQYTFWGKTTVIDEAISFSRPQDAREVALWLMKKRKIPEYVEDDLIEKLAEFIETTLAEKLALQEMQCLEEHLKQDGDSKNIIDAWAELYKREHAEFAQCVEMSDEKTFSQIYHTLIHSPAADTLFQLEHSYAFAVSEMLKGKENASEVLEKR